MTSPRWFAVFLGSIERLQFLNVFSIAQLLWLVGRLGTRKPVWIAVATPTGRS